MLESDLLTDIVVDLFHFHGGHSACCWCCSKLVAAGCEYKDVKMCPKVLKFQFFLNIFIFHALYAFCCGW